MALPRALLQYICGILLLITSIDALKFDMAADGKRRCIRNFVARNTLVVVTATVSGHKGDGQTVNMLVRYTSLDKAPEEIKKKKR